MNFETFLPTFLLLFPHSFSISTFLQCYYYNYFTIILLGSQPFQYVFFFFNLTTPLEIFEDDQQSCSLSLVLVAIVRPSFITDNHRLFVFASYYLFLCISLYIMHFVHSTSDLVIYCRGSLHKLTFQASTLRYYASIICTWKVVFVSLP